METVVSAHFSGFYQGRRVVVTGHTGFKGAWLSLWLSHLGARVFGLGLGPPTEPNLHEITGPGTFESMVECDVQDFKGVEGALEEQQPEIVFHMAAQPLVRRSYSSPLETFQTNALGTANLLEAVRMTEMPCTVIVVTTDKCYQNKNQVEGYCEDDPLGGDDVYSMSKAAAELATHAWRKCFFRKSPKLGNVASGRAGNVIGGGDYAQDRLVPDSIRALLKGKPIPVRNPAATRPWQHVLDCLSGYLWLGACVGSAGKESDFDGPFNFGPGQEAHVSVQQAVEKILEIWPGKWERISEGNPPAEAARLNLDISKATQVLGWKPVWGFDEAIGETVSWYHGRHVQKNRAMRAYSLEQIRRYSSAAEKAGMRWARGKAT